MTIQGLFNSECDKLLGAVDLFREILPSFSNAGAIHSGEEGRFIENLVSEFLKRSLPKQLEVSSGFVVSSRDTNIRSSQIDIVIYDGVRYAPIMKYGDAVIIHDKSLIAAISVKKNITKSEITSEFQALSHVGAICGKNGNPNPYLAVFALDIRGSTHFEETYKACFQRIEEAYPARECGWSGNEIVNDLIILNQFLIKKKARKASDYKSLFERYIMCGGNNVHRNIYLQQMLNGIARVLNDINKTDVSVLTEFPKIDFKSLGVIDICCKDRPYKHLDQISQ